MNTILFYCLACKDYKEILFDVRKAFAGFMSTEKVFQCSECNSIICSSLRALKKHSKITSVINDKNYDMYNYIKGKISIEGKMK